MWKAHFDLAGVVQALKLFQRKLKVETAQVLCHLHFGARTEDRHNQSPLLLAHPVDGDLRGSAPDLLRHFHDYFGKRHAFLTCTCIASWFACFFVVFSGQFATIQQRPGRYCHIEGVGHWQ